MNKRSKWINLLWGICIVFSCSRPQNKHDGPYTLIKVDSIRIAYVGEIKAGEFSNGRGLLHDHHNGSFVLFDTEGKVLVQKAIPQEGPESLSWVGGMRMFSDGKIFVNTVMGEIGVLDQDLNLKRKIEMPFPPEFRSMKNNARIMDISGDHLYIYYPGRDGISPYIPHYYKNYPLLEKVSLSTEEAEAVLKLPASSKYQSDLHFMAPFGMVSIYGKHLYHALDREAKLNVFDLERNGEWIESISLEPGRFVEEKGRKDPKDPPPMLNPGNIRGIYPFEEGVVMYYHEGIDQKTFVRNELHKRENFHLYPYYDRKILKIYHKEDGWSNEMEIPMEISLVLNIESPDQDFYALRNDQIIGEEQDYLTVYKMRIVKRD